VPNHGGKPGVAVAEEISKIEGIMRGPNAQAEYWAKPEVQERYRTLLRTRETMDAQNKAA
jgi:hypothetical protein